MNKKSDLKASSTPKLPEKLPPEQRKKLSIISIGSSIRLDQTNDPISQPDNSNYYDDPIVQPTFNKKQITMTEFLNDSVYLTTNELENIKQNENENNTYLDLIDVEEFNKKKTTTLEPLPLKEEKCIFYQEQSEISFSTSESNNSITENEPQFNESEEPQLKSPDSSLKNIDIESVISDSISTPPPIPPKRKKRTSSLCSVLSSSSEKKTNSLDPINESLNYTLNETRTYSLDEIRDEIFKDQENRICADCKDGTRLPNWFSCLYFITLCDRCAEIHLTLPHFENKYYIISIESLYKELLNENSGSDFTFCSFLKILNQTGNEKFNSLLEYKTKKLNSNFKQALEIYIKEKYISKKYTNSNELNLTQNYIDELNKTLYNLVRGPSVSLAMYYQFLGANKNYFQGVSTVLDNSLVAGQVYQTIYLKLHNAVRYEELNDYFKSFEFSGQCKQLFNFNNEKITTIKKAKILLKLTSKKEIILTQMEDLNKKVCIDLESILKVCTCSNVSILEIKWCNSENHLLLSNYLEFSNFIEKQIWLKKIFLKIIPDWLNNFQNRSDLYDLIETCQINSLGNLNLINQLYSDNLENVLLVLVESLEMQMLNHYFKKFIVLIQKDQYYLIDIRKVVEIKLEQDVLILIAKSKCFKLKSNGYGENLKQWHEKLVQFANIQFRSIEEQYLSTDNCPLVIEKCCFFVEAYFLFEKFYYSLSNRTSSFFTDSNKECLNILAKLERDTSFELDPKKQNPGVVLNILKSFFSKYFQTCHFDFMKDLYEPSIETLVLKLIERLTVLKSTYLIFYETLKRLCLHLNYVAKYSYLNEMYAGYLASLFSKLIHDSKLEIKGDLKLVLECLINNFNVLFDMSKDDLIAQYRVFDKLLKNKYIKNNNNFLITIFLFHKYSEQSFQLQIDSAFTCKDALLKAQKEFNFYESKYWSLFEVFDYEQHLSLNGIKFDPFKQNCVLLERILPTKARLIESISNWNSFCFVVKYNFIQIDLERFYPINENESLNYRSFFDKCQYMILCEQCGAFRTSFNTLNTQCTSSVHKKWQNADFILRSAILKIEQIDPIYEVKIEESQFYYGLYEHDLLQLSSYQILYNNDSNEDLNTSKSIISLHKIVSGDKSEILINEEECLTLYDQKQKLIYLIHLQSKEIALTRYCNLFNLAYSTDSWSYFKSDQMPDLKPKIPQLTKRFSKDS